MGEFHRHPSAPRWAPTPDGDSAVVGGRRGGWGWVSWAGVVGPRPPVRPSLAVRRAAEEVGDGGGAAGGVEAGCQCISCIMAVISVSLIEIWTLIKGFLADG